MNREIRFLGKVSAGLSKQLNKSELAPKEFKISPKYRNTRNLFSVEVVGDSMSGKKIQNGDFILVQKVKNLKKNDSIVIETKSGKKTFRSFVEQDNNFLKSNFNNSTRKHKIVDIIATYKFLSKLETLKKEVVKPKRKLENTLNNLNGSEWKFSSKSVINKIYPSNLQHKLRSEHGGQKPPELCADLIKIFSKKRQFVFDPYAGVGGTLLGASLCDRKALGVEINKKWIDIYKEVCELEKIYKQDVILGDSNKKLDKLGIKVDFILTDPPYWNMDKLTHSRRKDWKQQSKLSNFGSEDQSKEEWLNETRMILEKSFKLLKNKGYMAVFMGDMYRGKEYHLLGADLVNSLSSAEDLKFKASIIWFDQSKTLHIYGYPTAFIPSLVHQNILIFRKEQ